MSPGIYGRHLLALLAFDEGRRCAGFAVPRLRRHRDHESWRLEVTSDAASICRGGRAQRLAGEGLAELTVTLSTELAVLKRKTFALKINQVRLF